MRVRSRGSVTTRMYTETFFSPFLHATIRLDFFFQLGSQELKNNIRYRRESDAGSWQHVCCLWPTLIAAAMKFSARSRSTNLNIEYASWTGRLFVKKRTELRNGWKWTDMSAWMRLPRSWTSIDYVQVHCVVLESTKYIVEICPPMQSSDLKNKKKKQ